MKSHGTHIISIIGTKFLNNLTSADIYCGHRREIFIKRDQLKRKTVVLGRKKTSKLGWLNLNFENMYQRTVNQMSLDRANSLVRFIWRYILVNLSIKI